MTDDPPGVGLLFSAGKDSTLAALLLAEFYDVELVTATFGVTDDWTHARETAGAVGLPFEGLDLDRTVLDEAVDRIRADGYPRAGIQRVHEHALERVAAEHDAVADGTRRDDRVPTVSRDRARSLEDRHGVDYLAPLAGFGRAAVDSLADRRLVVETGPSESIPRADYEAEIRAVIEREDGPGAVEDLFPDHEQSRVTGVR